MLETPSRIPPPKILCILYDMINLIKVKKNSIAAAVALIMLFCVTRNAYAKVKYVKHILKGTSETALYIIEMCCRVPATMKRK